jgi:hypothetical protein
VFAGSSFVDPDLIAALQTLRKRSQSQWATGPQQTEPRMSKDREYHKPLAIGHQREAITNSWKNLVIHGIS